MHRRIALLSFSLCWMAMAAHSQIVVSPYSHYGIGDIFSTCGARSFGMGRIGIGAYDQASINRLNPASYADLRLTTFDFNGFVTYGSHDSKHNQQSVGTAGFHNVQLGFSNRKGFAIVAGIAPYSALGYDVRVRDSVLADTSYKPYTAIYSSSGGLNQLYLGFGIRFLKRVQAGINLQYAFGTNQFQYDTDFDDGSISTGSSLKTLQMKGTSPQLGLQYGDTIEIKTQVPRSREINRQVKELQNEQEDLISEAEGQEKDGSKLDGWEAGRQARIEALDKEKSVLEAAVKDLMTDESKNAKEIGNLQDEIYRHDRKRNKLYRDVKARRKENTDAIAKTAVRLDRIAQRITMLEKERKEIEEGRKESVATKTQRYLVRLGTTYDAGFGLKGTQLFRYSNTGIQDTLTTDTGLVRLPMKLGFGLSFSKPNKWMLGADVSLQDWSKLSLFGQASSLHSAVGLNVGGEWIPELTSTKFARKTAYRIGGFYNASFLTLYGNPIKEIGITAGIGLPIGAYNPVGQSHSRINLGVNLSRKGTLEDNLLRELAIQFRLGVNLNDIWFIKRRID
jgi:hypothetical protein